uniref:NACHT LRR and PYD domain-containing protein n=1 Tax=Stegastes partitus TaxID=144197 RepID=A0A3B4YZL5_9TELE
MCQIPVFCWITATVMKKMLRDNVTGGMPNSLTEMYVYLLLCQTDRMTEGHYPMKSNNVVLKLAELAFRQLEKKKLVFYEADLKECGINVEEATIYSGVCTEVFTMEGNRKREVFSFVHLTIQEFLAAVYVRYSYMQRKENVLLGYLKRMSTKLLPKSVFSFHKIAIEKALESPDGHWDLFLRFLLGLSLKSNQELLSRVLHLDGDGEEDVAKTIQFIKEKINEEPEAKLNLFHCLSELKEESLVQEIQRFMGSGRLTAKKLSPVQWSALTFELMTSDATEEEFDLKKYIRSEEGIVKLLTVITSSTRALLDRCNLTVNCCDALASALSSISTHLRALDLSDNNLTDSGVKLLSVGLRSPHCKLKSLRSYCCEALAGAVSTESTCLRNLDLSANDFHEAGLKALCVGLCSQHCKLETLRLHFLRENCCADLASVLKSGSSHLKTLDLSSNNLKDFGVSELADGLKSPHCALETLRLSQCDLTQKSCDPIGSALSSESAHLKELDLSGNNLHGIKSLCSGLTSQHCSVDTKITVMISAYNFKLCGVPPVITRIKTKHILTCRLNECNLQECCADLASVLSSDSSHLKELDLSGNDLQDAEVKLLCVGLASPDCTLETLGLSFCGITEESCPHLSSALNSNPFHLRQLDLSYNYLHDFGAKLSVHQNDPLCKLKKLWYALTL